MSTRPITFDRPIISAAEATTAQIGLIGATFLLYGEQTNRSFSLVEHPFEPRALAAPMHTHTREDEYSYILSGEFGFQLAESTVYAKAGELVYKPKGVPHTFWNASDQPGKILELISPGGFEHFFEEAGQIFAAGGPPDLQALAATAARYGLLLDLESVPGLMERYGVVFGG